MSRLELKNRKTPLHPRATWRNWKTKEPKKPTHEVLFIKGQKGSVIVIFLPSSLNLI